MFIGVDGGGTKTAFALIDAQGQLLAQVTAGSCYYPEVGLAEVERVLVAGIAALLKQAEVPLSDLRHAFIGLPAYGEDAALLDQLNRFPRSALGGTPFKCGNDMVCSWAGSLACRDGISVIAGTGSIAYGQFAGREARAGGWGELFSDEGSAYWIAREGLNAFSRMSDGRLAVGPLHALLRQQLNLSDDIDLCGLLYGNGASSRRDFAKIARIVHDSALSGDASCKRIFEAAGQELATMVAAVYRSLQIAVDAIVPVSYSGSVLEQNELVRLSFSAALTQLIPCRIHIPLTSPDVGAALYAGRLAGTAWTDAVIDRLAGQRKT